MARELSVRRSWSFQPVKLKTDAQGIAKIAAMVRAERGVKNLTQKYLAGHAGVCPATVSKLERGKTRSPHFRTVVDIMNSLGFDVTSHARDATPAQVRRAV
jgi:transcriptional regulator with XRE-family HTH domain